MERDVLDMALLRSPYAPQLPDGGIDKDPGELIDQGKHFFFYSFLPHEDSLADSCVMAEAASLNRKVVVFFGKIIAQLPARISAGKNVSLEFIKKAEKEDCLIIRIVETAGRRSSALLEADAVSLTKTDLTEWNDRDSLPLSNGKVLLEFRPFEIRIFKLKK